MYFKVFGSRQGCYHCFYYCLKREAAPSLSGPWRTPLFTWSKQTWRTDPRVFIRLSSLLPSTWPKNRKSDNFSAYISPLSFRSVYLSGPAGRQCRELRARIVIGVGIPGETELRPGLTLTRMHTNTETDSPFVISRKQKRGFPTAVGCLRGDAVEITPWNLFPCFLMIVCDLLDVERTGSKKAWKT